jgi:hypothetical protein
MGHGDGSLAAVLNNGVEMWWETLDGLAPSGDDSGQIR